MSKRRPLLLPLLALGACQNVGTLPATVNTEHIEVKFSGPNVDANGNPVGIGSLQSPLAINFSTSASYTVDLRMVGADGNTDTSFNSFVRITAAPGQVYTVDQGQAGRNVQMQAGVAAGVQVTIIGAYGPTRIWAEDDGYVPVDLNRPTPPACANGIDDNHNGLIDYPTDPGCFAPNDDTEDKGTGARGVSDIIYYAVPRVADIRGAFTNNGTGTPFSYDQVSFNTGFDSQQDVFNFDVVVTGLAADGFFFTDLQDQIDPMTGKIIDPEAGLQYGSLFAYTFNAPLNIGVCDRIRFIQGTTSDFFGYTELNFPTWETEVWDPNVRPCLVPDAYVLGISDWGNTALLFQHESGLVRVQAGSGNTLHVGAHIGPARPAPPSFTPGCDASGCATNCDLTGIGKVNYANADDLACANLCAADIECTEFSNYSANGGFALVMSNGTLNVKIQGNAQAAPNFDPVVQRGQSIGAFTGEVTYFSGGSQFTIQARCNDDVIADPNGTAKDASSSCIARNGTSNQQL